jgi:hypothetical protein
MKRRNIYWTRQRCLEAGALFFRERGVVPTNENWWHEQTVFTARTETGAARLWSQRPYPSHPTLKKYWRGMRAYWEAVRAAYPALGIEIPVADMPWSELEEWFILESVGLLARAEVSALLGRTEAAIKRRLYEMGINSYNRWGWTVTHLARVICVSPQIIMRYVDQGKLPAFRGHKCIYIEPADFLVIAEYNWAKRRHPKELEEAVRRSLMQRLSYTLLRFDWRKYSYHKSVVKKIVNVGRIKKPRAVNVAQEPKPRHIRVGDWCVVTGEYVNYQGGRGRVGRAKAIVWSPQAKQQTPRSPARPPCWVVTVEYRKERPAGMPELKRTRLNVAASSVRRAANPYEPPPPPRPQRPRLARKKKLKAIGERALATRLRLQPDPHARREL